MVQVTDVTTDTGEAVIGLNLTFTNLEEVQTERRGEGKSQKGKKKTQNPKHINIHKNIHTAGAWSRAEGRRKKRHKPLMFSPQSTAGFFY